MTTSLTIYLWTKLESTLYMPISQCSLWWGICINKLKPGIFFLSNLPNYYIFVSLG